MATPIAEQFNRARQVPPRVAFLTRSLVHTGGAEQQLTRLAIGLHDRGWPVKVFTFYDEGELRDDLTRRGVAVAHLEKRGRWDVAGFYRRLAAAIHEFDPAVVQSMLTPPNVVAATLPRRAGRRVAWGLRASDMDMSRYDWTHRLIARVEVALARRADLIVANSEAGRAVAVARGFPAGRIAVIANGIDSERFRPAPSPDLRARWLAGRAGPLIGMVARMDPMKDYPTFLRAARMFANDHPNARFVCLGANTSYSTELRRLGSQLGLDSTVVWEGPRRDVERALNAFDIFALSSAFGEGFPNVVAEAMSCAVPVVATDVGDTAVVVGDSGGAVVPRQNAASLALAWQRMVGMGADGRQRIGAASRSRIVANFSLARMIDRTAERYWALTEGQSR